MAPAQGWHAQIEKWFQSFFVVSNMQRFTIDYIVVQSFKDYVSMLLPRLLALFSAI